MEKETRSQIYQRTVKIRNNGISTLYESGKSVYEIEEFLNRGRLGYENKISANTIKKVLVEAGYPEVEYS